MLSSTNLIKNSNNISKDSHKIFITLAADYGNIGDMAITIAQAKILEELFPNTQIIEIPLSQTYDSINFIKKIANENDIFTIIGGGTMGNVYTKIEDQRRFFIENFRNNKIISFPQSIDFSNDEYGKKEFEKTINIYKNAKNLTIFSRELKSYNIMKDSFYNQIKLVPDVVLYLSPSINKNLKTLDRKNITICFRNDKEKITTKDFKADIGELLINNGYDDIKIQDSHIGAVTVSPEERYGILYDFLNQLREAKLVITDRLHGMIFSAITNTPCIAFDNSNKKISSTYETWLKDFKFIRYMEKYDEKQFLQSVNELCSISEQKENIDLTDKFKPLFNSLL